MSNSLGTEFYVYKRDGKREAFSFDKILKRIRNLVQEEHIQINLSDLVMKVIHQLYDGIKTSEIDELTGELCASMSTIHPDYGILANRIVVSNHQRNTDYTFLECMEQLYHNVDCPIVSEELYNIVCEHHDVIEKEIVYERDYILDYFGFKTLERAYLMKRSDTKKIVERPQHMWMRVSIGIHGKDLDRVFETYHHMSQKYFTHATPTLFNAGTPRPQLSSCYLLSMEDDSIKGIYNTLNDCAQISKWAGGIGLHIHNVRATGTHIRGTNGTSNGIVPMLRVFNNTARYVDQCVMPDTYIYTSDGPMEIQELQSHHSIFQESGHHEKVERVLDHSYDGALIVIHSDYDVSPLRITGEHPVLSLCSNNKVSNYVEAKELVKGDHIVYSIPQYENDDMGISVEDAFMYGLVVGQGIISPNGETSMRIPNQSIERVRTYLENKYILFTEEYNTDKAVYIKWEHSVNLPYTYSEVYKNHKMYISPRWLFLNKEKTAAILEGIFLVSPERTLQSRFLVECIRFLCLRLGFLPKCKHHKATIHIKFPYTVSSYNFIGKTLVREPENELIVNNMTNQVLVPIRHITKSNYKGLLYDLQMKNEHNYLIHNGIVHNGGGKRNGSFAMYLEPWHPDVEDFIEMKKNHGDEERKARDLFYALWIPDLFMERVRKNQNWTLMCPDKCPGLSDLHGEEFNALYTAYERENKGNKTIKARDLWLSILDSQIETGTPYLLYKDACNKKSNQNNLGTIKSSNLCTEIVEYSSKDETAVCNLASIGLSKFVKPKVLKNKMIIYTKSDCSFCAYAKLFFKKYKIDYKEINVDDDEMRQEMYFMMKERFKLKEDVNTVPQILYEEDNSSIFEYIGGYDDLVRECSPSFDYKSLFKVTGIITRNLNKIIDVNYYPTQKTKNSNYRHRPIGIGVQGLADVFAMMNIPFESDNAKVINKMIFETIYYASLEESIRLAKERTNGMNTLQDTYKEGLWSFGKEYFEYTTSSDEINELLTKYRPIYEEINRSTRYMGTYSSYKGSLLSKGKLQFDMWENHDKEELWYDWKTLRDELAKWGARNSLLLAPMPTASTSQILGNNECFEPFTNNIYTRRTLAGEFVVINKYLMDDLIQLGWWNEQNKNKILLHKGSIQDIKDIPTHIKKKYKTVWEVKMRHLIDMSRDRGAYICQSQSLNLWMEDPNYEKLTSMHFYAWKQGLKTGIYYLRSKAKVAAQQFTIEPTCESCSG